jgi:cytochrome c oxidase subunit 1
VTTERKQRTVGQLAMSLLTTTDHKVIGKMYLVTSFAFFLLGGVLALIIRAELAQPGSQVVDEETYNQLFTMHGTIMLLLFRDAAVRRLRQLRHAAADRRPDVAFPRSTCSATGCSCSAG